MFIDYTPTRRLVSGSSGELHSDAQNVDYNAKELSTQKVSVGGSRVTTLHRIDDEISITSGYIPIADRDLWKEFHASVAAGEVFTLDAEGSKSAPLDAVTVKLKSGSFKFKREAAQYFTVSFKVYEV